MTDLAPPLPVDGRPRPRGLGSVLLGGLLGGFALGVVARAWMHLIADDPASRGRGRRSSSSPSPASVSPRRSWPPSALELRRRRTMAVARIVGAVGMAPLFTAAGAIMLPTVLSAGLAWTRTSWRPVTAACAASSPSGRCCS